MAALQRLHLSTVLLSVAALCCPAVVHGDPLAIGLHTTIGETPAGLAEVGERLTLIPLAAPEDGDDADRLLRDRSQGKAQLDGLVLDHVGGLPGLDGLNASPEAFRKALRGLDPSVVRTVLGHIDPAILSNITEGLSAPLPGLDTDEAALPGLDGLPIHQTP